MIYDELTTFEIAQLDKNIPLLLVLAATEQHGAHLPLATDRLIGEHFARALHKAMPDNVLILPTIGVGCSSHHMDFSGSLTISHATFIRQVEEILESVIKHGFNQILMLNSHGGNQGVGQVLVEKMGHMYSKVNFVLATWWKIIGKQGRDLNETGPQGTGHAGEFETSLMLMISPHLVHLDRREKGEHNATFSWAEGDMLNAPAVSYFRTMKEMTSNGVYGDPMGATKEKGEEITVLVVDGLKRIVKDMLAH